MDETLRLEREKYYSELKHPFLEAKGTFGVYPADLIEIFSLLLTDVI